MSGSGRAIVLVVGLGLAACGGEATTPVPQTSIDRLVVTAPELTDACGGTWDAEPHHLAPDADGHAVLDTILRLWFEFGTDYQVEPQAVREGVTTVYNADGGAGAIVVVVLAFADPDTAVGAEAAFKERFGNGGTHRFLRRGDHVALASTREPVSPACVGWLWTETTARLTRLVP